MSSQFNPTNSWYRHPTPGIFQPEFVVNANQLSWQMDDLIYNVYFQPGQPAKQLV